LRVEQHYVGLGQEPELDSVTFFREYVEKDVADRYEDQVGLAADLQ
jgi:hypothetical protein